jgi:hypothetical protein
MIHTASAVFTSERALGVTMVETLGELAFNMVKDYANEAFIEMITTTEVIKGKIVHHVEATTTFPSADLAGVPEPIRVAGRQHWFHISYIESAGVLFIRAFGESTSGMIIPINMHDKELPIFSSSAKYPYLIPTTSDGVIDITAYEPTDMDSSIVWHTFIAKMSKILGATESMIER